MNYTDKIFDILLKKLDNLLNPKFANKYIFSLFFLGASLISYQNILSLLVQFEIITENFALKLQLHESNNVNLIYLGSFFVVASIILFLLERLFITESSESDHLQCNYYVCESYNQLIEISKSDLSNFPIDNPLILPNEIMDSLSVIVKVHPHTYRNANAWGERFSSKEDYIKKHPSSRKVNRSDGKYSYFQRIRTPTLKELKTIIHEDGLLKLMILNKLPIKEISFIGCYEDGGCGDSDIAIQEEYVFRKIWCAFLAIKNITDQPVSLLKLHGEFTQEKGFNAFINKNRAKNTLNLPKAPISPNSTVLIPISILLPPLYALDREEYSSRITNDWQELDQVLTHETIKTDNLKDFLTFNGQIISDAISYKHNGKKYTHAIHPFDLTNMYTIDRHLKCGSCPHLFLESDHLFYERELLAHCESKVGSDSFIVPNNVHTIYIAEIEDEITEIDIIKINGQKYKSNILLNKSDFIKITVNKGDRIKLIGKYVPNHTPDKGQAPGVIRNELIARFLQKWNPSS